MMDNDVDIRYTFILQKCRSHADGEHMELLVILVQTSKEHLCLQVWTPKFKKYDVNYISVPFLALTTSCSALSRHFLGRAVSRA